MAGFGSGGAAAGWFVMVADVAPKLAPVRPWMPGLCFPLPWPKHGLARPHSWSLRTIRAIGLGVMRINAHHERPDVLDLLRFISAGGVRPWPILDITAHEDDHVFELQLAGMASFAERLGRDLPWIEHVEIENEPSARMSVERYARLCIVVGEAMRLSNPKARIFIAAECFDFGTGKRHDYWTRLKPKVPLDLYDGVAIHPYRNPKPWSFSAFGSRAKEWEAVREAVGDRLIAITEFGWKWDECGEARQAENIVNELDEQREADVVASFIYAHTGEFGIFDEPPTHDRWIPRHAAKAVAHYFVEKLLA